MNLYGGTGSVYGGKAWQRWSELWNFNDGKFGTKGVGNIPLLTFLS